MKYVVISNNRMRLGIKTRFFGWPSESRIVWVERKNAALFGNRQYAEAVCQVCCERGEEAFIDTYEEEQPLHISPDKVFVGQQLIRFSQDPSTPRVAFRVTRIDDSGVYGVQLT
jgi:hypothetical protein